MQKRRTTILVLGMGDSSGLLALQFSIRALVEARGAFDEQARTALVEVQSVLALSPPPSGTGLPGLAPFRPMADSLAVVRAEAAEQRERAMGWLTACSCGARNRNVDFEFRSALLDRYGRPVFLRDATSTCSTGFRRGLPIRGRCPGPPGGPALHGAFPGQEPQAGRQHVVELTANLVLMIVLVFFTVYATNGLRKAERLNRLKSDLINNMTHELKTPISTIGLAGEALLDPAMADADNGTTST